MKEKILKILKYTAIVGSSISLVVLVCAAIMKDENKICKDILIEVDVDSGNNFLDEKDIQDMLAVHFSNHMIGQRFTKIRMTSIEKELKQNGFVEKVDLYSTMNGSLKINVKQKQPLIRIINNSGVSFYLGENTDTIPLSSKFTPRVLVAFGNISNKNCADLKKLAVFINEDDFWNACVEEVYVNEKGEYEIYTKLGKQNVILGKIDEELKEKFRKLKILYAEAMPNVGWNKYKTINLKYKGQIVCTKI